MSYEKQNWKNGDVITETKLNHMEDGIATGGGVLVVGGTIDGNTMTLDKTWQEIHDAGTVVLIFEFDANTQVSNWLTIVDYTDGEYGCTFIGSNQLTFTTDSADGYPSTTLG